jgi:putative transposase
MELSLRKREWIIRRRSNDNWSVSKICRHMRISRKCFYYHWKNYIGYGQKGLEIKSRRPNIVHKTEQTIVDRILELREKEEYGPNKMEAILKNQGMNIGHSTIYRILKDHRLNNPIEKPRKTWGKIRFQREHSNSLWQTDFKLTEDDEWMLTLIDDHSRFVVGCRIEHDATTEFAIRLLEKTILKYGKPKQILSDRGVQFFCSDKDGKEQGISRFSQFCVDNEIEHILASKRRPTTTGKVERWHRTYDEEHQKYKSLRFFVNYYNFKRPHQSLGYLTPADVYFTETVTHVMG